MNAITKKERVQLAGLLIFYILADTILGVIIGVLGYSFLSIIKANILIREIFFLLMSALGFLAGVIYSAKYYMALRMKLKSIEHQRRKGGRS